MDTQKTTYILRAYRKRFSPGRLNSHTHTHTMKTVRTYVCMRPGVYHESGPNAHRHVATAGEVPTRLLSDTHMLIDIIIEYRCMRSLH